MLQTGREERVDEAYIQDLVPECDNDRSSSGAFGGNIRLVYFKQAGFDEHCVSKDR